MPDQPASDDAIELLRQQIRAATDAAERLVREAGLPPTHEAASLRPAGATAAPRAEQPPRPGQPPSGSQPPRAEQPPRPGQPPSGSRPPRAEQPPRGSRPPRGERPRRGREPGEAPPSGREPPPTGPPPRRPPPDPPAGPPPFEPPPRAGWIPESGWDAPESHGEAASELQALGRLFATVRELLPEDIQEQLTELIRQLLLVLRAMIDWAVARIERGPRGREIQVEDIPIA